MSVAADVAASLNPRIAEYRRMLTPDLTAYHAHVTGQMVRYAADLARLRASFRGKRAPERKRIEARITQVLAGLRELENQSNAAASVLQSRNVHV